MRQDYVIERDDFQIHFLLAGDVLTARVQGQRDTYAISLEYWKIVAQERVQHGVNRLLIVEELEESARLDLETLLELFGEMLKMGLQSTRIAFIDRSTDDLFALQEHITILGRERGIQASVFLDEREALIWLRHSVS